MRAGSAEIPEYHGGRHESTTSQNTYARRHLHAGRTDEEVANLLGLSSHRTSVRLRAKRLSHHSHRLILRRDSNAERARYLSDLN